MTIIISYSLPCCSPPNFDLNPLELRLNTYGTYRMGYTAQLAFMTATDKPPSATYSRYTNMKELGHIHTFCG